MSVLSKLFQGIGKKDKIDKNVDDLFHVEAGPVAVTKTSNKAHQTSTRDASDSDSSEDDSTDEEKDAEEVSSSSLEEDVADVESETTKEQELPKKKRKQRDEDEDLEEKYFDRLLKRPKEESGADTKSSELDTAENAVDESRAAKKKAQEAAKSIDLKEKELEKVSRTVFVGNVTSKVITDKKVLRKFKKLFSQFGKVESIRLRSISFADKVPRKVAFVKKTLDETRATANAYVVFAEKPASLKCVPELNATVFEDFHLRVDHLAHPSKTDNKRTIFIGNLSFEESEETLWRYFNEVSNNDVEAVRIVRDPKTNFGKGFAFVQFKDTLSVNKALLENGKPIREGEKERKLRVTRASAKAKPSILSPNHVENVRKTKAKSNSQLSEKQKTKLGRAAAVLGKADRSTLGKAMPVIEGQRAKKDAPIDGMRKKGSKSKKKPRITDRSQRFKDSA